MRQSLSQTTDHNSLKVTFSQWPFMCRDRYQRIYEEIVRRVLQISNRNATSWHPGGRILYVYTVFFTLHQFAWIFFLIREAFAFKEFPFHCMQMFSAVISFFSCVELFFHYLYPHLSIQHGLLQQAGSHHLSFSFPSVIRRWKAQHNRNKKQQF